MSDVARDAQLALGSGAQERLNAGRIWLPQPQSVQAVFFDVGFTLLDPHPVPRVAYETLTQAGIVVERAALEAALPTAEALFDRLTRAEPLAWGDEQVISGIWRQYFAALIRPGVNLSAGELDDAVSLVADAFEQATSYRAYPDAQPVLQALRERGLKLGVISDWSLALSAIMRHHELTPFFDFMIISATARRAKPDPALFQTALERADAIPDYTLHIGDSYIRDALGARSVGITPILIDRGQALLESVPDCPLVYDLYELLDLLEIPRPDESAAE